jgi:glycosyltransferase involved in cell wall biosynthesis
MDKLVPRADDITTVSSFLRDIYGPKTVIVPHGRDASLFKPILYDSESLRRERGLDGWKIIMFLGTPKPHKGIEDIILSVRRLGRQDVRVVIVGVEEDDPFMEALHRQNKELIVPIGMVPFGEIPKFLSMADLIVLPQKKEPKTLGQIPAKVFDAMAMAKPIIATDVSDMAAILDGCGVIVEPGDIEQLALKIDLLLNDPPLALELGRKAREKFLKEYSFDTMESRLLNIFEKYNRGEPCMERLRHKDSVQGAAGVA